MTKTPNDLKQEKRVNRIRRLRDAIHAERSRHRHREDGLIAELRAALGSPGCTHKEPHGGSALVNVSDHGSSYRCRYCEIMEV